MLPTSANLRVKAFYDNGIMTLQVMDRGPGFPPRKFLLSLTSSTGLKDQKPEAPDWVFQLQKDLLKLIREQLLLKTGKMEVQNLQSKYQLKYQLKK